VLSRLILGLGLLVALALSVPAAPARAEADEELSSALCEEAILNGARRGGVPPEILHAISLTETGRNRNGRLRPWPWAINREGKGFWFATREEALAFAKASLEEGRRSFDVGCVQINYRWHGHAFPSIEAMFDPEYTATYAAQFLRNLHDERGSWSEAAGAYHSLTPELALTYRQRFDRLLAGLAPDALDGAAHGLASAPEAGPRRWASRQERREMHRQIMAERRRLAGPPPDPVNGSIAGHLFQPAAGALLVEGAPLVGQGAPLLVTPRGPMF
jgi:hypothetical protein